MKPFFIDTSGWCALYDKSDANHEAVIPFWNETAKKNGTLYTSDYVIDETLTLLSARIDHAAAAGFGRTILSSKVIKIIPVTKSRWDNAWELFLKYSGKSFSFTDCTSFAIMFELGLIEAFAFDKHFQQIGFSCIP